MGRTSAWIGGPLRQRWTQRVRVFAPLSTYTQDTDNLLSSADTEWLGRSTRPCARGIPLTPSLPLHTRRIFTASPALAKLILDPTLSFNDTGLPAVFEITEERVYKLRDEPKAKRGLILGDAVKAKL